MVTAEPDRIIYINHAAGGANYGHYELFLNAAETVYHVQQKATAGPTATNRHQGLVRYGLRRPTNTNPSFEYVRTGDEWGCGNGHVEANRGAYNRSTGAWALLCGLDACGGEGSQFSTRGCRSISFTSLSPQGDAAQPERLQLHGTEYLMEYNGGSTWVHPGNLSTLLSLGADGWLALAVGKRDPLPEAQPTGVGVLPIAPTLEGLRATGTQHLVPSYEDGSVVGEVEVTRYPWQWLDLPAPQDAEAETRYGFAAMAYFDSLDEESQRLVVGWSPTTETQGITSEYLVSEMDRSGNLVGSPLRLQGTGWGEDNLWQTIPATGCVAFPFAWVGEAPGANYPLEGQDASGYPNTMRFTLLCPVD
jgi:hypothetical protein